MPFPDIAGAASLFKLKMEIGDTVGGWEEEHILDAASMDDALPLAAAGCWFRTAWFGSDVFLNRASVSTILPAMWQGNRGRPDMQPVSGLDLPTPVALRFPWTDLGSVILSGASSDENDPFVGPMYQRTTNNNAWARMILRGLPDNYIQRMRWKGTGTVDAPSAVPAAFATYTDAGMPVAGTSSGTLLDYQRAFVTWVLFKTLWHRPFDGTLGPFAGAAWYVQSWKRVEFQRVRKLNIGDAWNEFKGHATTGK